MPRWDINDTARRRESEPQPQPEGRQSTRTSGSQSIGRGGSDYSSSTTQEMRQRQHRASSPRSTERRREHRERDRIYALRSTEMAAMTDIGTFRTVDVEDLRVFVYGGDEARVERDIESLRRQGLIEEKTLWRAHKPARQVVTLTEQGHRIVRKASGLRKDQRIYHGFVKAREINHDADLYRMYRQASEEVREDGGKPLRVRLDFELKAGVQREKQATKHLPEQERRERLQTLAERHGLTITGSTIHVPDIQMEYETRDGDLERANLELVSENYRSEEIRSKADSGFTLYARSGDTGRVRRALTDTHTVERILSL